MTQEPSFDESEAALAIAADSEGLAKNSAVQAVGTFVSRILGFIRTAMLTFVVGGSLASDVFQIANQLPTQLYVLISDGLLTAILIPQITKAMLNKERGQDFINRLLTLALIVLFGATALSMAVTPGLVWILAADKGPEAHALALALAFLCMPQIFFYGLYSVLGQVLNARGRFAEYAWAPAWANVVQIAGLAAFIVWYGYSPDPGAWTTAMIWLLGGTTTLGIVIQGLWLMIPLRRSGFTYRPRFGWRGHGFATASRMALWSFAAIGVSQLGGFFATWAMSAARGTAVDVPGQGSQQFAYSLFILPHSMITVSVVLALFPAMSRAYRSEDLQAQRMLVNQGLRAPTVLTIPASAALIALSLPLIRTIYWLDASATKDVALILAAMAIGLLPFGITTLKHNYLFAREAGRLNFILMLIQTLVQVAFSLGAVFLVTPKYAVVTISLGATLATVVISVLFIGILKQQLEGLPMGVTYRLWTRLILASIVAGGASWYASGLVAGEGDPRVMQLIALLVGSLVFVLCGLVMARVLKITEITDVLNKIFNRLNPKKYHPRRQQG